MAESTEGVRVATMRTLRVAFLSALSMDLIAGFGVGFVAMVLGLRLLWGELSLQTAMAVLLVAPEIFMPLRRAGAEFHASTEGQAAADRVLDVLGYAESRPTTEESATAPPGAAGDADVAHRAPPASTTTAAPRRPSRYFSLEAVPAGMRRGAHRAVGFGQVDRARRAVGFRDARVGHADRGWGGPVRLRQARPGATASPGSPNVRTSSTSSLADNLRLGAPDATTDEVADLCDGDGARRPDGPPARRDGHAVGPDGLTLSAGERQRVAWLVPCCARPPCCCWTSPRLPSTRRPPRVWPPAIEPWLAGRTVIVAAHEPLLLPHFDAVVDVDATRPMAVAQLSTAAPTRALPSPAPPTGAWPWPGCSGLAVGRRHHRPAGRVGLRRRPGRAPARTRPLVGILAAVEVLAFLRGPLRYAERFVGHDAALRALARWRVWLYDCLSPRCRRRLSGGAAATS